MQKIPLSKLTEEQRQTLNRGMKKSNKGRAQLKVYREAMALNLVWKGSSFVMDKPDYDEYMEAGK